jgi:hypothetical protein
MGNLNLTAPAEEPLMVLMARDVVCRCGYVSTLTTRKLLCIKCGKYLFYNEVERKAHLRQTLYFIAVIFMAMGTMVYFFVEMILTPLKLLME